MAVDRPRGQFLGDQLHFYHPAQAGSLRRASLSEQAISTHVATRSPSSASTQVFLQPIAMPRWSISAKDVKDNALLAELFADFEGFPGDAIRAWLASSPGLEHYAMEERAVADFLASIPDKFTRKKDLLEKLAGL